MNCWPTTARPGHHGRPAVRSAGCRFSPPSGRCSARGGGSGWGSRTRITIVPLLDSPMRVIHRRGVQVFPRRVAATTPPSQWQSVPEDHCTLHNEVDTGSGALRNEECESDLASHRRQQSKYRRVHPDLNDEGDSVQRHDRSELPTAPSALEGPPAVDQIYGGGARDEYPCPWQGGPPYRGKQHLV